MVLSHFWKSYGEIPFLWEQNQSFPVLLLGGKSSFGRRGRQGNSRNLLSVLDFSTLFSFSHNPKVVWFKSCLRNQKRKQSIGLLFSFLKWCVPHAERDEHCVRDDGFALWCALRAWVRNTSHHFAPSAQYITMSKANNITCPQGQTPLFTNPTLRLEKRQFRTALQMQTALFWSGEDVRWLIWSAHKIRWHDSRYLGK